MYTFVPNKLFGQLLDISPKHFIFLKKFDSELSFSEVWFTDQNSKPLEIQDKINIILVKNLKMTRYSVRLKDRIFVKGYRFLPFIKNMAKNIAKKISKNLIGKFSQKLLDHGKNSATDALKTSSKRVIQKTGEETGDLIITKSLTKLRKFQKIYNEIIQRQLRMNIIKKYLIYVYTL